MTHFLQQIGIEVIIRKFSLVSTCKRGLEREAVGDALFFLNDNSCRRFFSLLHSEVAVGEVKDIAVFVEQAREDLLLQAVVNFARVSIHKHILFS